MKPPPYVSIVLAPFIQLESLDSAARERLARCGLEAQRHDLFDWAIRFAEAPGELFANDSFVSTLQRLNSAGIAFGEDYKQGWAPADIMRELQARGHIKAPFTAIAWRGPGEWFTTVHEPPPNP